MDKLIFPGRYIPKYFKPIEFERCIPSCSIESIEPDLLRLLDSLREKVNFPIILNSVYRSVDYEISKGRSGSSAHCLGCAVDISCTSVRKRFYLVRAAIELGFTRIGIAKNYIHLDISLTHVDFVLWLY